MQAKIPLPPNHWLNQHYVIAVLLSRFVYSQRGRRVTLKDFVSYLKEHRDVRMQFAEFGHRALIKYLSVQLRSGAYDRFALSKGEGIIEYGAYQKQVHLHEFNPTVKQATKLGLNI